MRVFNIYFFIILSAITHSLYPSIRNLSASLKFDCFDKFNSLMKIDFAFLLCILALSSSILSGNPLVSLI